MSFHIPYLPYPIYAELSSRIFGTLKKESSRCGALARVFSVPSDSLHLIGPKDVADRQTVRQGLDVAGIQLVHLLDVLKDRPELAGELLDLRLGQLQPGQLGHLADLFCIDPLIHTTSPM